MGQAGTAVLHGVFMRGHFSTPLRVDMNRHSTGTAVIIGASSGIGEALAQQLNRAGWRLGLLARRLERLEALRQKQLAVERRAGI